MTTQLRLLALTAIACTLAGQTFDAFMTEGVRLFNRSDLDGAIVQFESAVQLQPDNTLGLLHLANAHASRALGRQEPIRTRGAFRALELYAQALAIEPDNTTALWNQAIVKLRGRDLAGAQADLEQYLRMVPGSADAFYAGGFIQWARAFPAQMRAREEANQPVRDPAPITDAIVRDQFRRDHGDGVAMGLELLRQALILNPAHEDALAYRNLLLRTKADMAGTGSEAAALIAQADEAIRQMLDLKRERGTRTEAQPVAELDAAKLPPPLPAPAPPPPPPTAPRPRP